MKLMPASSARWMIRIDSSWSVSPQAPNIIAPRQSGLTLTPVCPSVRSTMADETSDWDDPARGAEPRVVDGRGSRAFGRLLRGALRDDPQAPRRRPLAD